MNEICKKHVDACRFCWMCRHICPIGNATGLERNTSRARALGLSLVNREVYDISEVADNLYECACCGACTKDCVTGWDPVMFTKAARLDAALAGKLPPYIMALVENCMSVGNAYGKTNLDASLVDAIRAHKESTDTLLFLGVDARFMAPENAIRAIRALEKAGVTFTVLEDEPTSGAQLEYLIGAAGETKQQMTDCAAVLNGYAHVIVYDPQDAPVLKRTYGEWDIRLTADVATFSSFLASLLDEGKLTVTQTDKKATYHDAFQLARDLGETEEGRKLVSSRFELVEMLLNRKDTMWAGNILMATWMPKVVLDVAVNRHINAHNVGVNTIVCASVSEYVSLKNAAPEGVTVLSLEELVL